MWGPAQGTWVIAASLLASFLLASMPLPAWADRFWPDWPGLVLIYWCMALPNRVGIITAWCVGLLLDAAGGALLGQHAMALALVAYLALKTHQRVRVLPLWQQSLTVLVFLLVDQLLVFWINGIAGHPPRDLWYLAPAFGGALLWPWVFVVLRDLRRRHGVS